MLSVVKSHIEKFSEKLVKCESSSKMEDLFESYSLFVLYGNEVFPFCSSKLIHYNIANVLGFLIAGNNASCLYDPLSPVAPNDYVSEVVFTGISSPLINVIKPVSSFEEDPSLEPEGYENLSTLINFIGIFNIRPRNVWTDKTGKIVGPNGNLDDMKRELKKLKTKFGIHQTSVNKLISILIHVIFPDKKGNITPVLKFIREYNLEFFIKIEYLEKVVEKIFSPYEYKDKKDCFMTFKNIAFEYTRVICGAIQFSIRYMGGKFLVPFRLFDIIYCNLCLNFMINCGGGTSDAAFEVIESYYLDLSQNCYLNPEFKMLPRSSCSLLPSEVSNPGSFANYTPQKKQSKTEKKEKPEKISPKRGNSRGRGGLRGKSRGGSPNKYFKNKRGGIRGKPKTT